MTKANEKVDALKTNYFERVKVLLIYCLPAILACGLLVKLYHSRLGDVGQDIKVKVKVTCDRASGVNCVLIKDIDCQALKPEDKTFAQICRYRKKFADDVGLSMLLDSDDQHSDDQHLDSQHPDSQLLDEAPEISPGLVTDTKVVSNLSGSPIDDQTSGSAKNNTSASSNQCESNERILGNSDTAQISDATRKKSQRVIRLVDEMCKDVDRHMRSILIYNSAAFIAMVLLPFFLTGDLLGKSNRIKLTYAQRKTRAMENFWLKFILSLIMAIGWIYIINPLGRGASTLYQFFIAAGIESEDTLPIYIKSQVMEPVIAGFFGWYLHLIGYFFNKLVHHDVTSSRVYNLLFKKFVITYGIALILPNSGLIDDQKTAAFFMFLIGLFPLTAMSILIEAASKLTSGGQNVTGNLSLLPGISRWQILRLEEEGVDSMASLANIRPKTVKENLQMIEKLTFFWMDIAQLYTIVGHDGYQKIKNHCLTASEFVRKIDDAEFVKTIHELEGVGDAAEIARLVSKTFADTLLLEGKKDSGLGDRV